MNPSKAGMNRLHSCRHVDVNVTLERVPGWRPLVDAGYATLTKVPGIDIWVASSTDAGKALADAASQALQAEAYGWATKEAFEPKGANLRNW